MRVTENAELRRRDGGWRGGEKKYKKRWERVTGRHRIYICSCNRTPISHFALAFCTPLIIIRIASLVLTPLRLLHSSELPFLFCSLLNSPKITHAVNSYSQTPAPLTFVEGHRGRTFKLKGRDQSNLSASNRRSYISKVLAPGPSLSLPGVNPPARLLLGVSQLPLLIDV